MKIRINSIDYRGSIVDGPGVRTVLFLQGCAKRCDGCHNYETWDVNGGLLAEVDDIVRQLKNNCINKKLTISGGEPLLQYCSVIELVKKLKDFSIILYTGYQLDEVPTEILQYLDYIKTGEYIKEKRTLKIPYIGSKNQQFIDLRRKKNEID